MKNNSITHGGGTESRYTPFDLWYGASNPFIGLSECLFLVTEAIEYAQREEQRKIEFDAMMFLIDRVREMEDKNFYTMEEVEEYFKNHPEARESEAGELDREDVAEKP